jgi:hypothetical protein
MPPAFISCFGTYVPLLENIKFADAVMGYWGLQEGLSTVYTYDEKDFKKIFGLQVRKP